LTRWDTFEGGAKALLLTYLAVLPSENFIILDLLILACICWFGPVALLVYILEGGVH
jgi:hypothetical protein